MPAWIIHRWNSIGSILNQAAFDASVFFIEGEV